MTLNKDGYDFYEVKFTNASINDDVVNEEINQLTKAKINYHKLGFFSKKGVTLSHSEDCYLISLSDMYPKR